jgi:hypothetical protein
MPNNRLRTRLLVQCLTDAKLNNLKNYEEMLKTPDSYLRIFIYSIADIMDKELKNLAKRLNKKIEEHVHSCKHHYHSQGN